MSYFDKFINLLRRNIADYPPFDVVEVRPEDYARYEVMGREDSIICYWNGTSDPNNENYEIVVHKDLQSKTAYSLIRCKIRSEVQHYFKSLSRIIPSIIMICPNLTTDMLQEISNYVREHLNQSLAHICAHFGLIDYFKQLSPSDEDLINNQCPDTGLTPLHIAIRTGRLSTVIAVLALCPKLDVVDKEGNNALHFAAATNREMLTKLCQTIQNNTNENNLINLINFGNKDNFTPLYMACHNDKPDCIKELLKNGADPNGASIVDKSGNEFREKNENRTVFDQLDTKDMKNGGTPLHWTNTPQCIEPLLEMGCHIDARNFQGETVLHLMVGRNKLSCVITLLSYGADICAKGPNGNTPLHLAVKTGQVSMVQAIIVFGADVNLQNSSGETPRHLAASAKRTPQMDLILYVLHSVGALRCAINRSNCTDGCSHSNGSHFNGIPPENSPFKRSAKLYDKLLGESLVKEALKRKKAQQMSMDFDDDITTNLCKVLCLDGGGVRGLILIQMLWVLEVMMSRKISECFDWMSGTSTGGILALLLAMGHTAADCRRIYFKLKDKVFTGNRPYDSEPLERFLRNALGEDSRMSDIKKPRIMITATVADRFPPDLQLFRNYESPNDILGYVNRIEPIPDMPKPQDMFVWKTGRCSGAAPTYFRPMDSFLDGGLISNNPTLDTLTEIHSLNSALKVKNRESEVIELDIVVSLGTGAIPINQVPIIDIYRPSMSLPSVMGVARMAMQGASFVQLLVEQACQADGQVVERAKAWCSQINVPYFRLNPPLSEDINLNETDNTKLVNMLWETTAYMHSRNSEVIELITLLFD